ncbi:hypothetical protein F5J12DRAFT_787323 [Pisolithus orientalis]|uniref:uncharacterized protein n=1 Tax=Pisolithus orientalis TaxID=936130 RepID=UPI002223F655|nr:uncharacterized protein F5J12DRAFT_787323 [Pisolithus orientalis]KAI5985926.1 hypothetical protein F5J12DRAFT_787323 [Pisolithus orientalis]
MTALQTLNFFAHAAAVNFLMLMSDCQCGHWAVEALLNLDDTDPLQGNDYSEGKDAAQDDQPQGNDYDTFNIPDPFEDEEGNMQTTFFMETDNTNIPNPFEDNKGNVQTAFFIENSNIPTNCSSFVSSPHQVSMINHCQRVYHPNPPNSAFPVSFMSAKDLHCHIKLLPNVPHWQYQEIKVENYPTQSPIMLYWHNGLEVVEHLFSNPVFVQCMDISPYKEFEVMAEGQE